MPEFVVQNDQQLGHDIYQVPSCPTTSLPQGCTPTLSCRWPTSQRASIRWTNSSSRHLLTGICCSVRLLLLRNSRHSVPQWQSVFAFYAQHVLTKVLSFSNSAFDLYPIQTYSGLLFSTPLVIEIRAVSLLFLWPLLSFLSEHTHRIAPHSTPRQVTSERWHFVTPKWAYDVRFSPLDNGVYNVYYTPTHSFKKRPHVVIRIPCN